MASLMNIEVELNEMPITPGVTQPPGGKVGGLVEFSGVVRGEENGQGIAGLEYEAYPEMAVRQLKRLLETLGARHGCLSARVIHRLGIVPVGELAIYVGVTSRHRAEGLALVADFMDRLKQDVPIWKRRALPVLKPMVEAPPASRPATNAQPLGPVSLDEAIREIQTRCQGLAGIHRPLAEAFGQVLRETVVAPADLPAFDCSTRDGYAVRADDTAVEFQIMDTLHAADWKPRQLQAGEAVCVATGAAMPCDGLRVVMQEHVERSGDHIRLVKAGGATNLRLRGEEVRAGQPLISVGARLNAGALAFLATAGCTRPLISPQLRISHFTIGDELVSPDQTPGPGQIRDSNSILMRGLLRRFPCDLEQERLPEDFPRAVQALGGSRVANADVVLISGGASVGEKDFTRQLLETLGFEIIFAGVNVRPGKPLIFGVQGSRVAFGLPGNPLAHLVCFHFAVATALARLTGDQTPVFLTGKLASPLEDAPVPRETLWPARLEIFGGALRLHPLPWASSGDVTCFAQANALLRKSANSGPMAAGAEVEFLPANSLNGV